VLNVYCWVHQNAYSAHVCQSLWRIARATADHESYVSAKLHFDDKVEQWTRLHKLHLRQTIPAGRRKPVQLFQYFRKARLRSSNSLNQYCIHLFSWLLLQFALRFETSAVTWYVLQRLAVINVVNSELAINLTSLPHVCCDGALQFLCCMQSTKYVSSILWSPVFRFEDNTWNVNKPIWFSFSPPICESSCCRHKDEVFV